MTEAEWLAATDPTPMLEFLRGQASDRKLLLFACGCARNIWNHLGRLDKERIQSAEAEADGIEGMPRSVPSRVARHSGMPGVRLRFPPLTVSPNIQSVVLSSVTAFTRVHVSQP